MNNAVTHYNRLCVNLRAVVAVQEMGLWGGCMFNITNSNQRWSLWPHGLRRGSAAAQFVGLRVRILPGSCLSLVSVVCCQVEVCATGRSLVQRSPTECDREVWIFRWPWPTRVMLHHGIKR